MNAKLERTQSYAEHKKDFTQSIHKEWDSVVSIIK